MQTDLGDVVDPMATMVEQCRCSRCDDARREATVCSDYPYVGEGINPSSFIAQFLSAFQEAVGELGIWEVHDCNVLRKFFQREFFDMEPRIQRALIAALAKVLKG